MGARGGATASGLAVDPQEGAPASCPTSPTPTTGRCARTPSAPPTRPRAGSDVHWLDAVQRLRRERRPGVLVTAGVGARSRPARGRRQDGRHRRRHLGQHRRRQPRGDRGGAGPASCWPSGATAPEELTVVAQPTGPAPSTAGSAAAARSTCCSSRWPWCRRWRSSGSGTSASSSPASWPATTSSCTSSTPARSSSRPARLAAARRRRRPGARAPRGAARARARRGRRRVPTCSS